MRKISFIDNEKGMSIIDHYEKIQENKASGWAEEQLGLFLYEEKGRWVAIDNRDGNAWTEDFAGAEVALKWLLDDYTADEAHALDHGAPCKLGADAYVLFTDEGSGVTDIDAFKVTEISNERIWLNGDKDLYYGHDEIGENVFLSREDAVAYAKEHGMRLAKPDLDDVIQACAGMSRNGDKGAGARDLGER